MRHCSQHDTKAQRGCCIVLDGTKVQELVDCFLHNWLALYATHNGACALQWACNNLYWWPFHTLIPQFWHHLLWRSPNALEQKHLLGFSNWLLSLWRTRLDRNSLVSFSGSKWQWKFGFGAGAGNACGAVFLIKFPVLFWKFNQSLDDLPLLLLKRSQLWSSSGFRNQNRFWTAFSIDSCLFYTK